MPFPIRSRDELLAVADLKEDVLDVPEWETSLRVRGLSLSEVNQLTNLSTAKNGKLNNLRLNVLMFIRGVVEPKFTDEDYDVLARKSGVVLRVALRISELSGIGKDALESALKNSASDLTDDSSLN